MTSVGKPAAPLQLVLDEFAEFTQWVQAGKGLTVYVRMTPNPPAREDIPAAQGAYFAMLSAHDAERNAVAYYLEPVAGVTVEDTIAQRAASEATLRAAVESWRERLLAANPGLQVRRGAWRIAS